LCHAMWAAVSPNNRIYIYRERVWKGVDVPFWATEVGTLSEYENLILFILCGSAWQDRGIENIKTQVHRYSGMKPTASENSPGSRVSSLQTVQDFLRWEQKPQKDINEVYDHGKAQEIWRRFGDEALKKYVDYFKPYEPEDNLPKLQILSNEAGDPVAPILVETIPICIYDEKRKEDIAEFEGDDPIDNLRYLCKFAYRYMNGMVGEELERRKKTQEIIDEYQRTQDANKFYRRMEFIEAEAEKESFGVRRAASRRYN
jgi:hypothetical protein